MPEKKHKQAPWSSPVMADLGDQLDVIGYDKLMAQLEPGVYRLFLKTLWLTGRRPSELCRNLKVRDISRSDNIVKWFILKKRVGATADTGQRGRPMIRKVDAELVADLLSYADGAGLKPDDYVFPFSRQTAWRRITDAAKRAGVYAGDHHPGPRTMRHSFALSIVKAGRSIAELLRLKEMLCHTSINQSIEYAEVVNLETQSLLDKKKAAEDESRRAANDFIKPRKLERLAEE